MPVLVRQFIKTAFIFLLLGLITGLYMLYLREIQQQWPAQYLITAHLHAVVVGFVLFMILGVALWMFPRPLAGDSRYKPQLMALSYWLLLGGTSMRFVLELWQTFQTLSITGELILIASLVQVFAVFIYIWNIWSRIRPPRRVIRESNSEQGNDKQARQQNVGSQS